MRLFSFLGLMVGLMFTSAVMAWEVLPDAALSETTGQEGIGLQIELRINANAAGQPLTLPADLTLAANPTDYANCGSLTNFSSTGCRLALQFANRLDNGGEWLVAKNFYGRILWPLMYVDSGTTPATASPYVDLDRFKDKNGTPLIASPNSIPYVSLSYPKEIEIWNMTIGGLSIEYGATGYLNNAGNKSVGGIKISNSVPGLPATVNFQGSIGIYGF